MSPPTYKTISLIEKNNIAWLKLNRPESANGLNLELAKELLDACLLITESKTIKAVILSAEGKFFSAGGDLKSFAQAGEQLPKSLHEMTVFLHNSVSYLHRCSVPVVCAINGMAAGAGVGLALCGDYIITGESAKFTLAYTNAGLTPDCGATYFLPRLVGLRKAQDLLLNNTLVDAQEALNIGLVSKVVKDEELEVHALAVAQQWANGPANAFKQVKSLLVESFDNNLEQQLFKEAQGIANAASSSDGQEGIAAFLEKRKPKFAK